MAAELDVSNHSRDSAGLHYVYPVVSRRAGGISVGINLNTNNACNWRCIYCQVEGLVRGSAPPVDLALLEQELRDFLHQLLHGDFMLRVPEASRRLNDIALSGNGEPTSANEFVQVIELVVRLKQELALPETIKLVLITNGSLIYRKSVQQGLALMAQNNGEVWFKLDRANETAMELINGTKTSMNKVHKNLATSHSLCPTWLQTCWMAVDGRLPDDQDENDYLNFLDRLIRDGIVPHGVLLYTLARTSRQAEAPCLSALSTLQMASFAAAIQKRGITVKISS